MIDDIWMTGQKIIISFPFFIIFHFHNIYISYIIDKIRRKNLFPWFVKLIWFTKLVPT